MVTVANRIEPLEAEERRAIRQRDGYSRTIAKSLGCERIAEPATGEYRASLESEIVSLTEDIKADRCIQAERSASGSLESDSGGWV